MTDSDDNKLIYYNGRIPACGVFCGGCPVYTRDKKACPGAESNIQRCENCKTFHLCCKKRNIEHCYECSIFPCAKFKGFAGRWLKYGQNLIENQYLLNELGIIRFRAMYNSKANENQ